MRQPPDDRGRPGKGGPKTPAAVVSFKDSPGSGQRCVLACSSAGCPWPCTMVELPDVINDVLHEMVVSS